MRKYFQTGPTGNSEDCFPLPRNGNKNNSYNLMKVTVHFLYFALFVCYCYSHSPGLPGVQTALSKTQLTNKYSPEIADCVNGLRGNIIALHYVEVTNVIQVDPKVIRIYFECGIPV